MHTLIALLVSYGLLVVFLAVLLDQGGLPVPAYPVMMVASAVAVEHDGALWPIVLVAVVATVLADSAWFLGGRRYGSIVLKRICQLSLSPDACIGTTHDIYARWGARSLILAKFIPGFAAVATTVAGQTRTPLSHLLLFDGLGALAWTLIAVILGALFHNAVYEVIEVFLSFGHAGLALGVSALALYVVFKAWKRHRFIRLLRMARISPSELHALMQDGEPLVLDVRSVVQRDASGWIPGAVWAASTDELDVPTPREVIVYCDCPNEASAAQLAHALLARGFTHVRPLAGGFEAWRAEGLPVEVPP